MPRFAVLVVSFAPLLHGQASGSVEGVVVNRMTGAGIGGVSLVLYTSQAIQYETTTDASGNFQNAGMRPGAYQVRYEKDRFKPFREEPAAPYTLEPGKGVRLRLEMTPLVTLRGRVLTSEGKPAQRAQVRMGTFFAFVNERGEFVFDQLQPGSYTMIAEPGPSPPSTGRIESVRTAFPQRIVVRGDTDLSGYEIRLKSAPVDRVAGVVRDEIGQPVRGTVRLLATAGADRQVLGDPTSGYFQIVEAEPGDGPLQASTTTAEDGSFEFPSVPSGDWRVAVDSAGRFGDVSTSVGRTDVGDLNIRLLRPVSFSMNVTVDWGGAPPSISLLSTLPGRKVSLPDGSIRLENVLPGRYRVIPLAGRSSYPASALFGGKEVLGQTIAFFAGSPELRILYKSATGSVSGIAPAGSTVALLSAAGYGRIARCDPSGAFSVATVAPGEYFVSAFDGFDASFLTDPELSTKIAARGTKVTVRTGPAASVEVKTIRWPE